MNTNTTNLTTQMNTMVSKFSGMTVEPKIMKKFTDGKDARDIWSKTINYEDETLTVQDYNSRCKQTFKKIGSIILDDSSKRLTLKVDVEDDMTTKWKNNGEYIYLICRDNIIVKIGGTRTSMKERWGSYCCGFCVPQRTKKNGEPYPGKMSVTNAYLYHTIEADLLEHDKKWDLYIWELPVTKFKIEILGVEEEVIAQTFHAYETCCFKIFKEITGKIPVLCNNCDPKYL
jgi:hypothetical protein